MYLNSSQHLSPKNLIGYFIPFIIIIIIIIIYTGFSIANANRLFALVVHLKLVYFLCLIVLFHTYLELFL